MEIEPCAHELYHIGSGPTFDGNDSGRLDWCTVCGALRDGADRWRMPMKTPGDECSTCRLPLTPESIAEAMREDGECWRCSLSRTSGYFIDELKRRIEALEAALLVKEIRG